MVLAKKVSCHQVDILVVRVVKEAFHRCCDAFAVLFYNAGGVRVVGQKIVRNGGAQDLRRRDHDVVCATGSTVVKCQFVAFFDDIHVMPPDHIVRFS